MNSKLGEQTLQWHYKLAQVTGGLSLRITKRTLVPAEVQEWARSIQVVANEMFSFVNGGDDAIEGR